MKLGRLPVVGPRAAFGALLALALAGTWWALRTDARRSAVAPVAPPPSYTENGVCLGCHTQEARQWQESHHAQAMAPATASSVRGDFQDRGFASRGVVSRFFKRGDAFMVRTEGPEGRPADFQIKYTFGVEPLQQYLVEMPGGRLQPLNLAWDGPQKRWFDLLPNEKTPPGDVLHWTGRYQTANTMCLVCHVTRFEKGYDVERDSFVSRWAEPNVSCQACHGPGDRHVRYETSMRGAVPAVADSGPTPHGLIVDIRGADPRKRTELCAPCHSRRSELTASPAPGEPLLDNYLPSLLIPGLYHADGQQREEVYVDTSFRQSRMFQKGVTCTDCHNPHSGKLKLEGSAVCLQCHRADPNPRFPTAAGNFDSPAHHFHKEGSKGASCAACHMPSTTYMQIQHRPDHSIRVPRPDVSAKIGAPDACTNCHQGRKAEWAAEAVSKWYGAVRKEGTHYGEAFAAARAGKPEGVEALAQLLDNPLMPGVVRASALAELSRDPQAAVDGRIRATRDTDPVVRAAAAASLDGLSAEQRVQAVGPLLADPVRAVRIAAAFSLSSIPEEQRGPALRPAFDAALAEYVAAQSIALDMPGGQFNLAMVYENTGRQDLAERHYLGALRIDPDFAAARHNLVHLYASLARSRDAERVLREGVKRRPEDGGLQYSLGLLLADEKRTKEAVEALARAARLLPDRANVQYNYGLALEEMGQSGPAEAALRRAHALDPGDPSASYALAIFYERKGNRVQALEWAERLRVLRPDDPQVLRLIAGLRPGRVEK